MDDVRTILERAIGEAGAIGLDKHAHRNLAALAQALALTEIGESLRRIAAAAEREV